MKLPKLILTLAVVGCMAGTVPLCAYAESSSEIMEQIEGYMADLEASQQKSEDLEDEIASKQQEVGELFSEVTSLNIKKADYYEDMKQRISYFYEETKGYSFLEILFSSKSFSELLNRIQFQQSLYDYDSARLEEYETLVDDLEQKQDALDEEIDGLGDMIEEQTVLQATLDTLISAKQDEYDEAVLAEEAAAAAAKAAAEEAERRAQEEALAYVMSYETEEPSETESASGSSGTETASASEAETSYSEDTYAEYETSAAEAAPAEEEKTTEEASAPAEKASAATSSGSYDMPTGSGILTWSGGVNYFNGHMETWYTMREWTGDLGIPGMYIGSDGIVRDCDGYICVASDDLPKGTVVETSLGTGKVYDCGPGSGIIDIYTDWPLY